MLLSDCIDMQANFVYGKYPKISNTFFALILYLMLLFHKIIGGKGNSVDPDQTARLIWVCTVCICHFIRKVGV